MSNKYNSIIRRRQLMQNSDPVGLTWIQNVGNSWINTGIKIQADYKIEMRFAMHIRETAYVLSSGSNAGINFNISTKYLQNAPAFTILDSYGGSTYESPYSEIDRFYTIYKDGNKTYYDGVLVITHDSIPPAPTLTTVLFALRSGSSPYTKGIPSRIAQVKIWNGSGVLLCDLVPHLDNGEACMFDNVGLAVHKNGASVGSFIVG